MITEKSKNFKMINDECALINSICNARLLVQEPYVYIALYTDYISPLVKVLLNKRNKFRRQGNRTNVDKLVSVIDELIANNMRNRLRKLALAPVNELWKALKLKSSTRGNNNRTRRLLADPENGNQYFADI
jgi:predicted component of type VI protein secretion system